jgi:3-hydroxyisobutyrate dehydrogenase
MAGINDVMTILASERPDVVFLDAPVSGSKDPAERGQLIIFASGPDAHRSNTPPASGATAVVAGARPCRGG